MIEVEVLELVLLDEEVDEEDVLERAVGVVVVELEVLELELVDEDVVELEVLELVLVEVEIAI